jgi:DNA-directed RNA polymerase II subunit RPB11
MSQDYRLKISRLHEKKLAKENVEVIKGQKMINSVTYRMPLEDHTVGDLLRIFLLKNKDVKFAGYRQVHPLEDVIEVKVQTSHEDTNKVVKETLLGLQRDLFDLETTFDMAYDAYKKKGVDPTTTR